MTNAEAPRPDTHGQLDVLLGTAVMTAARIPLRVLKHVGNLPVLDITNPKDPLTALAVHRKLFEEQDDKPDAFTEATSADLKWHTFIEEYNRGEFQGPDFITLLTLLKPEQRESRRRVIEILLAPYIPDLPFLIESNYERITFAVHFPLDKWINSLTDEEADYTAVALIRNIKKIREIEKECQKSRRARRGLRRFMTSEAPSKYDEAAILSQQKGLRGAYNNDIPHALARVSGKTAQDLIDEFSPSNPNQPNRFYPLTNFVCHPGVAIEHKEHVMERVRNTIRTERDLFMRGNTKGRRNIMRNFQDAISDIIMQNPNPQGVRTQKGFDLLYAQQVRFLMDYVPIEQPILCPAVTLPVVMILLDTKFDPDIITKFARRQIVSKNKQGVKDPEKFTITDESIDDARKLLQLFSQDTEISEDLIAKITTYEKAKRISDEPTAYRDAISRLE